MKSYWIWLVLHLATWTCAMQGYMPRIEDEYWRLLGAALYFLFFFIMPLVAARPKLIGLFLGINTIITAITLVPWQPDSLHTPGTMNLFILLVFVLIIGESVQRLPLSYTSVIGVLQISALVSHVLIMQRMEEAAPIEAGPMMFITMTIILLYLAAFHYKKIWENAQDTSIRYDALLSEYRNVKRQLVTDGEMARREERNFIGQEIHDSVGHKLTALLMQLEAYRLKMTGEGKKEVQTIKQLAEESLDETRKAVKAFKREEIGGLQGVLRLIRRLEMDSFLRIQFSIHHGAFTAPLSGEQSFVLYRSIQEALTNMMKHGRTREAIIVFEAPGGSVFRFEVSNPVKENKPIQAGYGLTALRERLEKNGGTLEVFQSGGQFVLRGQFSLLKDKGEGQG